jgi:hypothetical protein
MTCPQCRSDARPDAPFCGSCGMPFGLGPPGEAHPSVGPSQLGASASQFPRTPGDQYIPSAASGQHGPPASAPPREFRLDLRRLSRADQIVGGASLVVLISLFLPWFGFSTLGASISATGTTAHGYLVLVVITALLIPGYLLLRSGWGEFPFPLPVAHEALLLTGTGVQFLLVLIGFLDRPAAGLRWETGAYLAVAAAALAAARVAWPAVRSRPDRR